nr:uncharacterized protein LOC128701927 [Cherax quadricarinatus]
MITTYMILDGVGRDVCAHLFVVTEGRVSAPGSYLTVARVTLTLVGTCRTSSQSCVWYKSGRCPTRVLEEALCPEDVRDQCQSDQDCAGTAKCCSTGCAKVCIRSVKSTCELMRENTLRRARDLGVDANDVVTPDCDLGGGFAPIQCDGVWCFCVDERTGYELPGTRARSIELVNCSGEFGNHEQRER